MERRRRISYRTRIENRVFRLRGPKEIDSTTHQYSHLDAVHSRPVSPTEAPSTACNHSGIETG